MIGVCLLSLALLTIPANPAPEVPPLPEAELESEADLIVEGVVTKTQITEKKEGELVKSYYLLEVKVDTTLKGKLSGRSGIVGARGWRLKSAPNGYAGASGHYSITGREGPLSDAEVGSKIKLYLEGQEKDGTRKIVGPNGFELTPG
jgi:hypothetical protein